MLRTCSFAFLLFVSANALATTGYSHDQNEQIWHVRNLAKARAENSASQTCHWGQGKDMEFNDDASGGRSVDNPKLFEDLMSLLRLDQNARAVYLALKSPKSKQRLNEVDADNFTKINSILAKNGFPTVKQVGLEGSNAALMLVTHADDHPNFQRRAYQMVQVAASSKAIPTYFPLVLASIRSEAINGRERESRKNSNTPRSYTSGESCFYERYQADLNTYIAELLPANFAK